MSLLPEDEPVSLREVKVTTRSLVLGSSLVFRYVMPSIRVCMAEVLIPLVFETVTVAVVPDTLTAAVMELVEVVTEVPFVACVLGFLLLASTAGRERSWRGLVPATLLLAFIPFQRTIGVALIGAVAIWAVTARSRLRWLACAVVAALPTLLWTWRNSRAGGPTYLGSVLTDLSRNGLAFLFSALIRSAPSSLMRATISFVILA